MIGYLSGTVKFFFGDGCILDVHGGRFKSGGTVDATCLQISSRYSPRTKFFGRFLDDWLLERDD